MKRFGRMALSLFWTLVFLIGVIAGIGVLVGGLVALFQWPWLGGFLILGVVWRMVHKEMMS